MYSDSIPIITSPYSLSVLSESGLQVPLCLTYVHHLVTTFAGDLVYYRSLLLLWYLLLHVDQTKTASWCWLAWRQPWSQEVHKPSLSSHSAGVVVITASWCSDSWQHLASNVMPDVNRSLATFILQDVIKKGTPAVKVTSVMPWTPAMFSKTCKAKNTLKSLSVQSHQVLLHL